MFGCISKFFVETGTIKKKKIISVSPLLLHSVQNYVVGSKELFDFVQHEIGSLDNVDYVFYNINCSNTHWTALYHNCDDNTTMYFVDSLRSRSSKPPTYIKNVVMALAILNNKCWEWNPVKILLKKQTGLECGAVVNEVFRRLLQDDTCVKFQYHGDKLRIEQTMFVWKFIFDNNIN